MVRQVLTRVAAITLAASTVMGCATSSIDVAPMYVPDSDYASLTCDQVSHELRLAHMRVEYLANNQESARRNDATAATASMFLFWPAAFLIRGDGGANVGALARAKGERDALIRVSTARNCDPRRIGADDGSAGHPEGA